MTTALAVSRPAEQRAPLSVVWQSRWGLPIGYALTSEAMALALDARGVRVMHRPTAWHMPARIQNDRLHALAARPIDPSAPQVSYDQADLFDTGHPGYKIGYTMLEVDGPPRVPRSTIPPVAGHNTARLTPAALRLQPAARPPSVMWLARLSEPPSVPRSTTPLL